MAYQVLARKWRPKNFEELIGQPAVQQTLTNALSQKRIHPVFLFIGPRGTGKTSTARIVAKILRCQEKKNLIPCETCENCKTIQEGQSLDVIEIDGASNNGVEAVRELRDTLNYMASSGFYKVYIIDEVHMLSTSAFNALLKTLEEPPEHVVFLMATTTLSKIPQTVLSRCQKLDFHLIPRQLIQKHLTDICEKENISFEKEALWLISKQAQGSLRDAQSLLDQMTTFCNGTITSEKIVSLLGLTDPYLILETLQALLLREDKKILKIIRSFHVKGGEPRRFFQTLLENVRDLLFLKLNPKNQPPLVQTSEAEIEHLKLLSEGSSYEDLHFLFDMMLKAEKDLLLCHDQQMAFEVLLFRLIQTPRIENLTPLKAKDISSEKKKLLNLPKPPTPPPSSFSSHSENSPVKNSVEKKEAASIPSPSPPLDIKKEKEKWFNFIDFLKKKDQKLAASIENLSLEFSSENRFTLLIPKNNTFLQFLTEPKTHKSLETFLTDFLKLKKKLEIQFQISPQERLSLKTEKLKKEEKELFQKIQSDPFVKKINQVFKGKIKTISKI